MTSYEACGIIEGFDCPIDGEESPELFEALYIEAVQYLITSGQAWQLQGFYGRLATNMIDAGYCHR